MNSRKDAGGALSRASDAGYAAVDALVALTIFATTIVFAVAALHTASRSAAAAVERQRATQTLSGLLERAGTTAGTSAGESARFSWRLIVHAPEQNIAGLSLCEQEALATARSTGRSYRMVNARICPAEAAA